VVGVGDNARHSGVVEDLGHATIEYGVGPCGLGSSIRQDKKQAIWCKPANSVSTPLERRLVSTPVVFTTLFSPNEPVTYRFSVSIGLRQM
jgi:hypothetical protein